MVLRAFPKPLDGLSVVGRTRPMESQGPEGEGHLGVQEANWLPEVQEDS